MVEEGEVKRFDKDLLELSTGKVVFLGIDFASVHHVGSRVLGILVALHDRLGKAGGGVVLFGLNPAMERVLKVTRLQTVLPVAANEQAARDYFAPHQ